MLKLLSPPVAATASALRAPAVPVVSAAPSDGASQRHTLATIGQALAIAAFAVIAVGLLLLGLIPAAFVALLLLLPALVPALLLVLVALTADPGK